MLPHHKHNETQKKNQVVQKTCYITGRVEDTQRNNSGSLNKNRVFRKFYNGHIILRILRIVNIKNGLGRKGNKARRGIKQMNKYAHKKERII
jgi:hypothetical protein